MKSPKYYTAIDGLRLLASINIVLFHFLGVGGFYEMGGKPVWFFRIVGGPAVHASIFFLLGGFIFTSKFLPKIDSFSTKSFLRSRFLELYPLHLVTTLLMALLTLLNQLNTGDPQIPRLILSIFMHLSLIWSIFPFETFSLNTPSWALSAFFFCYLLFGVALRFVQRMNTVKKIAICAGAIIIIQSLWGLLFRSLGAPEHLYSFFHIFAPIRFFEFLLGMLIARLFMIKDPVKVVSLNKKLIYDFLIVILFVTLYYCLLLRIPEMPFVNWFSYHVLSLPIFAILLYLFAMERGYIVKLFSISIIRKIGRSSFYPYLIHIPLMSGFNYICEHYFNYKTFLHNPLNIFIFTILLYIGSYFYVEKVKNPKKEKRKQKFGQTKIVENNLITK